MGDAYVQMSLRPGLISTFDSVGAQSVIGDFYAGNGQNINNPDKCWVKGSGPIPMGWWTIGAPENHPESVGEFALLLTPDPLTVTYDRTGFFWHGANPAKDVNGAMASSDGCPVSARGPRVIGATFTRLQVVP